MYLEKLEINGFKSFANKNELFFPEEGDNNQRGITAIVGPNGSGKSNIADAIRWVLGEQSSKTLRSKKSEDVIFSGSEKKSKLGMAEVSLFLNNERSFPDLDKDSFLHYKKLSLTRRLFRNGESQYLINNHKVKLEDVQMMLAKANFGQKTYSVIGQGLVENFLNSTTKERKKFFDEATGVKEFQIKKDKSIHKLETTYQNLEQVDHLLQEIEPRLNDLTKQIKKLEKKEKIEAELKDKYLHYFTYLYQKFSHKISQTQDKIRELQNTKQEKEKKLTQQEQEIAKLQQNTRKQEEETQEKELNRLQQEKNDYIKSLSELETKMELTLESKGKFDLSWWYQKQDKNQEKIQELNQNIDQLKSKPKISWQEQEKQIENIDTQLKDLNQKLFNLSKTNNPKNFKAKEIIEEIINKIEKLKFESLNASQIKTKLEHIKQEFYNKKQALEGKPVESQKEQTEKDKIQTKITELLNQRDELYQTINEKKLQQQNHQQELNNLQDKIKTLKQENKNLQHKIDNHQTHKDHQELQEKKQKLQTDLDTINHNITTTQTKLKDLKQQNEEEKNKFFDLQKENQQLQQELNDINQTLNNLNIEKTKQETNLDNLKQQIKDKTLINLKDIEDKPNIDSNLDTNKYKIRIDSLETQLKNIGAIDPETQEEYQKTKERYEFLSKQSQDLKQSITSLKKVISELDKNIKTQFHQEFEEINKNFNKYFKTLFNGGRAKILQIKDSQPNSQEEELVGIDIQATPPQKKITSISMLSGGERALTAIALICAIIKTNPSPFVVLDEVDASLDEANSQRLAKILEELSYKTQFILVTHNQTSMKKASLLYGVTMTPESISKLLSIKLDSLDGSKIYK